MLFCLVLFGTSRNDCQLSFVQKQKQTSPMFLRGSSSLFHLENLLQAGALYDDVMEYQQSSSVSCTKTFCTVFLTAHLSNLNSFVFIAPHFIPVSFSDTSAVILSPLHIVSEMILKNKQINKWGVLQYISDA